MKLKNVLRNPLRLPSVDDAISGFTKALDNLRDVEKRHLDQAQLRESEADRLLKQAVVARRESARASTIISKLEGLLR